MTDIHSHILPDIDDGSNSIDESIDLLETLYKCGFNSVILTPHYINTDNINTRYVYNANNEKKLKIYNELKKAITKNNLNISIYLGNEIFLDEEVVENIKNKEIYPLNNSKYILIELPLRNKILNLEDILYEINYQGYIPIIAHPERYTYFQSNYEYVDNLKQEGVLFQCNYTSVVGYYGKEAEKLVKYMLKNEYVDYLGTDIHHKNTLFESNKFYKIEKKIIKEAGEKYYNKIKKNCDNLVKDLIK